MSRDEKLIKKLIKIPANFTYDEMITLLKNFGYTKDVSKRSSGSAVMFFNREINDKIMFHKPHPQKEMKKYILKMIVEKLRNNGMIK